MKKTLLSILLVLSLCLTLSAPTWATEIDTGEKSASEMSNTGAGEPKAVDTDAPDTPSCSYDGNGFCTDAEHTACYQPAEQADDGYYEIGNAGQLYWFAAKVNGEKTAVDERPAVNGRLTADITVNSGTFHADGSYTGGSSATPRAWTPIGTDTVLGDSFSTPCNAYSGTFDGGSHTVSGLYYDRGTADEKFDNIGLFGSVYNATVKDVSLKNSYFGCDAIACVGGIVGRSWNKTNDVVIDGCTVDSTTFCAQVNVKGAGGKTVMIGGIVGYAGNRFTLRDCTTGDAVTFRCSASEAGEYDLSIGGIVGYVIAIDAEPTVVNCHNRSKVSATNANAKAKANAGGIVGNITLNQDATAAVTVEGCHNSGAVSAAAEGGIANAGGIAGYIVPAGSATAVTVEGCYNSGAVSAAANAGGTANAGGIAGDIVPAGNSSVVTVEGCHNSGAVSATGEDEDDTGEGEGSTANAGGIAGAILPAGNSSIVLVEGCHNSGMVSITADKFGTAKAGGIAGAITTGSGSATAVRCFYLNTDAPADAFASGTTGKTSAQFASGEVCYLLNGETSVGTADDPLVWHQTLGSDSAPVLERTHGTVYASNVSEHYNNTATDGAAVHVCGTDGKCVTCGKLVCPHTDADGKPLFGADGKCSKCGYSCEHSTINDETGKCESCGYQYAVWTNLDSYPWLKSIDEVPFGDDGLAGVDLYGDTGSGSTLALNGFTKSGIDLSIDLRGYTLKSSISASTSKGLPRNLMIQSHDDNGATSGTFDGSISYNTDNDKLLHICDGVTVTGKVTINGSAGATGQFWPDEGAIFAGGIELNVPDKTLKDYLLLDTALAKKDADGNYTVLVDSNVTEITEAVKVVAHKSHTYDATTGKCGCGAECPHSTINADTGKCTDCGYQKAINRVIESDAGSTTAWFDTVGAALTGVAENTDTQLYLYTDVSAGELKDGGLLLLVDLNGHTLTANITADKKIFRLTNQGSGGKLAGTVAQTDGSLLLYGDLTVTGLVTISDSAALSAGVTLEGGVKTTAEGKTLADFLEGDAAFCTQDESGSYTVLVDSGVTEITEAVKVVAHTSHTFTDGKCACGYSCPHEGGFDATTGKCVTCGKQKAVRRISGSSAYWYDSFEDALNAVRGGETLKLYADAYAPEIENVRGLVIDLNGHKLSSSIVLVEEPKSGSGYSLTLQNSDETRDGTFDGGIDVGVDHSSLTIKSGVTVTGEVSDTCGDETLNGTITLHEGVTLAGGITVQTGRTLKDYLVENTALARKDTTGSYTVLVDGYVTETVDSDLILIEEPVKVVAHTSHTYDATTGKCACGYSCPHGGGFDATTGKCVTCGKQKAVKRTLRVGEDSTTAWFDTVGAALTGLDSMAIVRLDFYEDVSAGAVSAGGLNLTLSLNGHTLTANITVAGGGLLLANDNASSGGKLAGTVTNDGTGMFSTCGDVTISGLVTLAGWDSFAVGTKLEGGAKTVAAGRTLAEHLNSGAAFARSEAGGIAGETIVDGSVTELTGALKVIAHESHTYDATTGKCACGAECPHGAVSNRGVCTTCGHQLPVCLMRADGKTFEGYATVAAALAAAAEEPSCVLTLYADLSESALSTIGSTAFALNGHTLTANITVGGTASFANGTVNGTINASEGNMLLFGENVRVNGRVTVDAGASIAAGTIFAGGIEISGAGRTLMDILPDGTAFAKQGALAYDTVVSAATASIAEHVMLVPHTAHTALSDPTHCACGRAVAAKLSQVNDTSAATYYTTIGDAFTALNAWTGETPSLTVLANGSIPAGTTVTHLGYLQLNGKTVTGDLTIDISTTSHSLVVRGASGSKLDGTVTVRSGGLVFNRATGTTIESVVVDHADAKVSTGTDAGTINALTVKAGSVSLSAGTFGTITVTADGMDIGDLLAEGYGIKLTDGTWLDQTAAQTTLTDVTVQGLPVMVTSLGGNERLTYGDSLSVTANIDPESAAGVQYEWLVNGTPVAGVTGTSYAAGIVDAGTYTVTCKATLDGYTSTATKTFTVAKKTLQGENFTQPKALTSALTYNGSAQALVAAGAVDGGATIRYSLDKSTWTSTVPTATDAGDYTVYWYVDGGTNYTDFYIGGEPFEIEVSIGQLSLADTADYSAPTARSGLAFSERAHQLIDGAATPSGVTAYYSLDQVSWTTDASTLTRTDAGDYPVYWYVDGGTNYASIASRTAPNTLTAHIAPLELVIADVRIEPKYYDGTTAAEVVFEFHTGDGMGYRPDSSGYTVDAQFETARVGSNIPVVIKLTITSDNYILRGGTKTYTKDDDFGEIRKAAAPRLTDGSLSLVYTKTTGTFDLAALGIPTDADAVDCVPGTLPAGVESARVDGTTLTVTLASGGKAGDTFTLPLTVYSENYNDAEASVVITLIAKTDRALTVTMDGWTFGGTANAPRYDAPEDAQSLRVQYKVRGAADATYTAAVPTNAGEYTVRVSCETETESWSGSADFTVAAARLTGVSVQQSGMLSYNGDAQTVQVTAEATALGGETVRFTYSMSEDGVYGAMPQLADAGDYTVYYEAGAANHIAVRGSFTVTIAQATPHIANARADVTYGQSVAGSDITAETGGIAGSFQWKDVSSYGDASDGAKTLYARFVPTDSRNYETIESVAVSVTVAKAVYSGEAIEAAASIFVGQTRRGVIVDLSDLLRSIAGAEVNGAAEDTETDPYDLVENVEVLTANRVRFDLNGGSDGAHEGVIEVNISSTNYQDITAHIVVTSIAKSDVSARVSFTGGTLPYTGSALTYERASVSGLTGGSWTYSYAAASDTASLSDGKPLTAGGYTVTAFYEDAENYAEVSVTLTVAKATPTGAPRYTVITASGKTLADAALATDDFSTAGTVVWVDANGAPLAPETEVTANTSYLWRFTPDDTANYESLTGSIRLWSRSSSGGSTSITVPVSSDSGSVKVDASVSGSTARVSVSDRQLDAVAADGAGSVTVDVSGLKRVTSAVIPAKVVETVDAADDTGLTVALASGSVSLDETALTSAAADAKGRDVTVSVVSVPTDKLPTAVRNAIGMDTTVVAVVDVDLTVGGAKLSDFRGGKLTIRIPYTPKAGEDTSRLAVWFVRDDGTIENKGGRYDAAQGCFVFETEHLSQYLLVYGGAAFADVPADAYYASAVNWAVAQGITNGVDDTHFAPDLSCTRAQIVTFLYRAAGSPAVEVSGAFEDVAADAYYAKAVAWAVAQGITNGTSAARFSPDETCTRAQAVVFLFRYAAANGMSAVTMQELVSGYGDAGSVPGYALPAFNWALARGIVQGANGELMPNDTCTRAQIVTLLQRTMG